VNRCFRVKLNLPLLTGNLAREDARDISHDEVIRWAQEAGFTRCGDSWLVAEANLGHLDPSEVLAIDVIDVTATASDIARHLDPFAARG